MISEQIFLEIVCRVQHINASIKEHLHAPLQPMSSGQLFLSEMKQIASVDPFQSPIYKHDSFDIDIFPITFLRCPQQQHMLE